RTLEVMKDNGLRLLLVGYESGNQQILFNIKKGMRVEFARRFTKDCHELAMVSHGTFSLGLPGETRQTIQETLDSAKEINPHTIQVSLAAPYPGTFLYRQAKENGWLYNEEIDLLTQEGTQIAPLNYPHLSHGEIFDSVEDFYKKFYFRPSKIASIVAEMIASPEMMKRRLRSERRRRGGASRRHPYRSKLDDGRAGNGGRGGAGAAHAVAPRRPASRAGRRPARASRRQGAASRGWERPLSLRYGGAWRG